MPLSEAMRALRTSVALSREDQVRYLRVRGRGGYDALDRIFPRELYLRDGQLMLGLLLGSDGAVFADCCLGSDEDEFVLLVEGPDAHGLLANWERHTEGIEDAELVDLCGTHSVLSINGPYAWELLAKLVGPEVVGLPYLTFFHHDRFMCCRTGKTGEYGYQLLVPRVDAESVWADLVALGASFDLEVASLADLDQCALENGFFNMRMEGTDRLSPLDLQLQWRISRKKDYVGFEALRRRRLEGVGRRTTHLVSNEVMSVGDMVSLAGKKVGRILNAGFSAVRDDWVALALVDLPYSIPGLSGFTVGAAGVQARSSAPPVLRNRSLFVNPQVHTYASRGVDAFPPLVDG